MQYAFSGLLGRCDVELSGEALKIASAPPMGSTRVENHSVDTIWPVPGQLPCSATLRSLLLLPGCLALIATLVQSYNLYKTSLGLYVAVLLLAFGILFYGAWLGTALRFCTLALRKGQVVLRVIGTAKNQATMAKLVEGLKGLSAKEPGTNGPSQHLWVPEDAPQWPSVNYSSTAEDQAKARKLASQGPKSPDVAPLSPGLLLFYWAACLALWVPVDKHVFGHMTDLSSVFATFFALIMAIWLLALHGSWRGKSLQTAAVMSTEPDSSVYLTPEAMLCNYPTHSLALHWHHAKQLILEESGIAVFHSSHVIFIPARAFVDASHRTRFVNGIMSLAPHLNAQINSQ
jgi:hypothetical protein